MDNKIHIFEEAKLGKAPFRVTGLFEGKAYPDEVTGSQGCTGCAYCYTGITNCFQIESSDGKHFIVGSTCVKKTGDKGMIDRVKAELRAKKAEDLRIKYQKEREERWEREKVAMLEQLAKMETEFNRMKPILESKPHPVTYFAEKGKTMFDYVMYFIPDYGSEDYQSYHPTVKLEMLCKGKVLTILREAGSTI